MLALWPQPSPAYITNTPVSFGQLCSIPPHISEARIEKVGQEKGVIIWRKIRDLKGKYPFEVIKHSIGKSHWPQFNADMQKEIMRRAVVGKTAIFFHGYTNGHGNDINVYLDEGYWYAVAGHGEPDWCYLYSDQPVLLRLYCGSKERLATAVRDVVAGKEVVVPCLVDGSMDELRRRATKIQQLRASLKLQDYNPKRDFVRWGAPRTIRRWPACRASRTAPCCPASTRKPRPFPASASGGDGKPDLCLIGAGKVALLRNDGDPMRPRCRGWPAAGPRCGPTTTATAGPTCSWPRRPGRRLFTNLGDGNFQRRHRSAAQGSRYNLTAAAWIDYDGDGRPDILLCNGFHGLRLYRNKGQAAAGPPKPGEVPAQARKASKTSPRRWVWAPDGIAGQLKGDTLTVCDVNGDGRPDFLYGAGSGILVLNTPKGFVEAKDSGISYKPGKVGPTFGDFDNSGHPGLFVPQLDGRCKLFRNDGTGHFTDITAQAGDLAKLHGHGHLRRLGRHRQRRPARPGGRLSARPEPLFPQPGQRQVRGRHASARPAQADLQHPGRLPGGSEQRRRPRHGVQQRRPGSRGAARQPPRRGRRTPVLVHLGGSLGARRQQHPYPRCRGQAGGEPLICGGGGRGGQQAPLAHFSLAPGKYQAVVRYSSGGALEGNQRRHQSLAPSSTTR